VRLDFFGSFFGNGKKKKKLKQRFARIVSFLALEVVFSEARFPYESKK